MRDSVFGVSASVRIRRFLKDHPDGELFVAVGIASVAGIAWLGPNIGRRAVTLVIDKTEPSRFRVASAADRATAVRFLHRADVEVASCARDGAAGEFGLRVWAVVTADGSVEAALVGPVNLTNKALRDRTGIIVQASGSDLRDIERKIALLRNAVSDCRERITGYLEPDTSDCYTQPDDPSYPAGVNRYAIALKHGDANELEKYDHCKYLPVIRRVDASGT